MEDLQRRDQVRIIASCRDPGDVCLSMLDAAVHARQKGFKAFSRITDLDVAIKEAGDRIEKFRRWASVQGALRLDYETVAFSPDLAIDRIERYLNITSARDAARRHALEHAFTQQNKMKRRRFEDELAEEEKRRLTEVFGEFLREVCVAGDDAWFTSHREHMLLRAERAARKGA